SAGLGGQPGSMVHGPVLFGATQRRWAGAVVRQLLQLSRLRAGWGRGRWPLASLAQAGISALCINQRPGYTMDAVARYGEGLAAVKSAIDLLSREGEIDRARVGMGGLSFGGKVTMFTLTESNIIA